MRQGAVRFEITKVEEIGGLQYVSGRGFAGQYFSRVLRIEGHGIAASPPVGSIGIAIPMGGSSERMVAIGIESPFKRPSGIGSEETILYGPSGKVIKVLSDAIEINGGPKITLTADEIVLAAAAIRLGSAGASRPASAQGTLDSGGFADTSNLATKVFVE